MYGQGVCQTGELIDLALEAGFVNRAGAWYSYGRNPLRQGRDKSKIFLQENPEVSNEIANKVRAHYNIGTAEETGVSDA